MDTRPRPRICEIARPTSLEQLLTLEETTDVTLVGADGKNPLRAHKAVLASVSDFFMRMFFGEARKNWEENGKGVVRLEEFSSDAVRMIVDIVYMGRVEIPPEQGYQSLLELFSAADFFNMPVLQEVCHYFLRHHGKQIVQNELQDLSLPLLRKVLASDALGCEEIAIFKAVEQWIEARKTSLSDDDIKEVLGMVRYGLIPAKELVSVVGVSKWKDEALVFSALNLWIEPDITKINVPQHLARANTFPLLPFTAGAFCIGVEDGAYSYQVNPLKLHQCTLEVPREWHPHVGVLLAVDNLEMPITVSSQLHSLSFSFCDFPETDEQAITFSPGKHLTNGLTSTSILSLGSPSNLSSGLTAHAQPRVVNNDLFPHPVGLPISPVGLPIQPSALQSLSASSGGAASKFVISKHKDVTEIAQDPPGGNIIKHEICSATKYILIGVKVDGHATLKHVPSSDH